MALLHTGFRLNYFLGDKIIAGLFFEYFFRRWFPACTSKRRLRNFLNGLFQAQLAPGFVDHYTGEDRIVSILVLAGNEVYAKGVVTSHFDAILGE